MAFKRVLLFITTFLSVQGISRSLSRNNFNLVHRYSNTYENDWRPVSNQEAIKYRAAPSTNIWSYAGPVQSDIKKLQDYLTDQKMIKAQINHESKEIRLSPILENYNHFTHPNVKFLPSETRKYSFLLPTNRDPFILQESSFTSRTVKPNIREPTPYYTNIPKSYLMSELPHSSRQHFFTANIKPSFPPADQTVVTYMNQNLNKQYSIQPSVDLSHKFLNTTSGQQYYNRNTQHESFQSYNQNPKNNLNIINQSNSQKINKEYDPNNIVVEYPENSYVTAPSRIKYKPIHQNYVIPSKVYTSNLLPMQINYLHHYSSNVKKNHSETNPKELNSDNNRIKNMYKIFRETSTENNKDLVYSTSKYVNVAQTETNLDNTTPFPQQFFREKIIPEQPIIKNKYRGQENNEYLKQYDYTPLEVSTLKNVPQIQELGKQTEFLPMWNKHYNRQQEESKVTERQEELNKKKEGLRYSGLSDQISPEKYNLRQEVESKRVPLRQHNAQNKSFEFYENVLSRLPVTNDYIITTELPLTYNTATYFPKKEILPEEIVSTPTLQTMTTVVIQSEKELERVKSHRNVGKHRRRPIVRGQKPLTTTPKITETALYLESTVNYDTDNRNDDQIIAQIDTKFINIKNDNKIETTRKNLAVTTESFTSIPEKVENNFAVTEGLNIDCLNFCSSNSNNYEYTIDSAQTSAVNNQDTVTEPSKLSTIDSSEKVQEMDNVLTTAPAETTKSFSPNHESKILATTPASFVRTTSKIRFSRPANTLRPRFSIKDYKSKLEDKNRKSQISMTESSTENIHVKKKFTTDRKQFEPMRDMAGRYKYMSRISYRTSSTPSAESQENTTVITQTRKKIPKYFPKERLTHNLLNMNRVTPPTFTTTKLNSVENLTNSAENNYSSIRTHDENRNKLKLPSLNKDEVEIVTPSNVDSKNDLKVTTTQRIKTMKKNFNLYRLNAKPELKRNETLKAVNNYPTLTSEQEEEALLEKASQSVADLTSSASSLHNKASMSKTVANSSDKKVFSSHYKSTYDTPTLPIEAFFHDLPDITN